MAVLGYIADDFIGANDAAPFLVKGGMSIRSCSGIPDQPALEKGPDHHHSLDRPDNVQAIVIALKSRTQETSRVVADGFRAVRFPLAQGVKQIYFKYCSTFNSTPKDNIGSIINALMDLMKAPYTPLCPVPPANGRAVEHGMLLVNDIPLRESHMKNHLLTPTRDCRIDKLMKLQSRYECRRLTTEEVEYFSPGSLEQVPGSPLYLIPDYGELEDGGRTAAAFDYFPLLTRGNGLLELLAQIWTSRLSSEGHIPESGIDGKAPLLTGSCSEVTLGQIAWYQNQGKLCYKLGSVVILDGRQALEDAWRFIETYNNSPDTVLAYSSDIPEKVKEFQKLGIEEATDMLESATVRLAVRAVEQGYTRITSTGGETSDTVTRGLGFSFYRMGENVAPGVPIMAPAERPDTRLILRGGNFRQKGFFGCALTMTSR